MTQQTNAEYRTALLAQQKDRLDCLFSAQASTHGADGLDHIKKELSFIKAELARLDDAADDDPV